MKRIKNTRAFIVGIIAAVIAAICFAANLLDGIELRFLVSGFWALAWSAMSFYFAFSKKGLTESVSDSIDERDQYITMKSGKMALQILNYILWGGGLISSTLYGIFRQPIFMIVAATLCAVILTLFIIILSVNIYYEKHN
ncbi:hypothetical protein [Mahella sp.]|uniref:hypothetical protein n=1 Tax=Mahella sp. TaxID=2798721 RepID=UPI0025C5C451|nr:hypothetical protein [Mahella sp.]MBZ4665105.1 putative rane protein [Mahella sp.]MDK2902761.1 hypothetical protein [Clostridiales bacterium]